MSLHTMSDFPDYLDVDYADGEGEDPADYPALEDKIEKAVEAVRTGSRGPPEKGVLSVGSAGCSPRRH